MKKIVVKNEEMFPEVAEMLAQGRQVTIPVKGVSMLPFIVGERDLVVLEAAHQYKKDDIVLFCIGGRWILHRIIEVGPKGPVIRGDGILKNVERPLWSNIHGRAVSVLRHGKKPVNPYSGLNIFLLRCWNLLRPVRRYLLYIYRHLPWNKKYFK